ncbi:hypothetical protein BO99DRAFT_436794 [Aspergillus violaceofuscus CBS 115571]|uniref:RRM domain-containing protein n=1 Tax=Aspergillus violaceofuscus (strain CBS 115571) TaxID=1450538 RepID=A0A2V5HT32_ASPV1|nr:hypothetical protein BO99DRAFT_436794 [Aspergillus violaceofuscus CBS 115571]
MSADIKVAIFERWAFECWVRIVRNRRTLPGTPGGRYVGFVTFRTVEEAQRILTDVQANNQPIVLHGMRLRLEEARGEGIHPQPVVNGPRANGHTANGHTATRHTATGPTATEHTANGPTVNGHVVLVVNGHTATGHTVHGHTAEQPAAEQAAAEQAAAEETTNVPAAPATPSSSGQESAQQSEATTPASE